MNLTTIIKEVQTHVGAEPDGKAGPDTWGKIREALIPAAARIEVSPGAAGERVDARSEGVIKLLLPEVWPYARALVHRARERGITIKLISGHRTYEEQNALYAQGRTKPGAVVTKAKGGYSNHNFGIAFDIGIFSGASYVPESPLYKVIGAIGLDLGLDWGGNWKTFKDEPHYQLRPAWAAGMSESAMLAELRSRKASGKGVFA